MAEEPVERALERLRSAPASSWRDVPALARRRRRTRGALASAVVVLALGTAVVVARLGSDGSPQRGALPSGTLPTGTVQQGNRLGAATQLVANVAPLGSSDPAAIDAVARSEQGFAVHLLQAVPGSGNVSVSPASLALALSMLENGARGSTEHEIATALGSPATSAGQQDEGWAGLTAQWRAAAQSAGIDLSSANSLWLQHGLPMEQQFMATLARYYASGVWQVDFRNDMSGALSALNAWTAKNTGGRIPKLFDSLDPSTVMVLANAVYFHAAWQSPFAAEGTQPAPFHAAGAVKQADFMTSDASFASARTADYVAAEMPYQGGRFAALAVQPTHGTLNEFVGSLDGAKLASISAALTDRSRVKLPKFTTASVIDLAAPLQALGVRTAFTSDADFSAMSTQRLQVSAAVQRVYLKVGEKGTEAAAATGIGLVPTLAGPAFDGITFDHPFLFLVRDTHSGAVLFAARIVDPS